MWFQNDACATLIPEELTDDFNSHWIGGVNQITDFTLLPQRICL